MVWSGLILALAWPHPLHSTPSKHPHPILQYFSFLFSSSFLTGTNDPPFLLKVKVFAYIPPEPSYPIAFYYTARKRNI